MSVDVLGFATKATKNNPRSILSSKGTQKDLDAIRKNAGALGDVIGEGADDSYKKYQQQQQDRKNQQQKQQQQVQQQQQEQAQKQKQANSLLGKTKSLVSNVVVKPIINTGKAVADTGSQVVAKVSGNKQAASNAQNAASTAYKDSAASAILSPIAGLRDQTIKQVKHLAGPTSTQAQRDQLMNTQTKAQIAAGQINPTVKTSNPSGGNILDRAKRDVVSVYQHVNPFSDVHKANDAIGQTQKQYGLTPEFIRTLHNANTSMTGKKLMNGTAQAVTTLPGKDPGNVNRSLISNQKQSANDAKNASVADNLVHEGLHQVWAANPQLHGQFASDYNKNTNPQLQSYLRQTLNISKNVNLGDFNKLPTALQDEIHSATIHYYTNPNGSTSPQNGLTKYYSQFLNPAQAQATNAKQQLVNAHVPKGVDTSQLQTMSDNKGNQWLEDPSGKKYPVTSAPTVQPVKTQNFAQLMKTYAANTSAQGKIKAEQMLAQGKKLPEIEQFLQKDQQAMQNQNRKAAATAVNLATDVMGGSSIKSGIKATKADIAGETARTGVIGSVNNQSSLLAENPGATKEELAAAGLTGIAGGSLLHLAGHFGGQPLIHAIENSKTTKDFVKNQAAKSLLDKAAAQTAEKNKVAASKIDQKIELIQAKKPDGKFTNVDKVKIKQLKDEKAQLIGDTAESTTPVAAISGEAKLPNTETAPTLVKNDTSDASVASAKTPVAALPDSANIKEQITKIKNDEKSYDPSGNIAPEAAKQINDLNKQLNAAGERIPKTEKPVTVTPVEQAKVSQPEIGQSKLAASTEQKAIDKKLTNGFEGKPEYAKINTKDQAKAALELHKADPERATRIALGQELPPEHLLPESVYIAVENHALKTGDGPLLKKLATESSISSQATGMGQRIRMLGERDPDSVVSQARKLAEVRKKAIEQRIGKTQDKAVSSEIRAIRTAKPKIEKETFQSFVESLKC